MNIIDYGPTDKVIKTFGPFKYEFTHVEYSRLPTKEEIDSFFMYGDYMQMSPRPAMEEVENAKC
jgi:hypothetical protein